MTDNEVSRARMTPENLKFIRDAMKEIFEAEKDAYDPRDVARFNENDDYANCFLRWTRENEKSVDLVKSSLKWRKENKINDLTVENIGVEHFKTGYIYTTGRDVDGNRVLYQCSALHRKDKHNEYKQLLWFWLERLQQSDPASRVTFIMDIPGSSLSNTDMDYTKAVIAAFQEHFPGMLNRIIIYEMPWLFNKIFSLVRKFLSEDQKEVTVMCTKSDITKYINEENLPTRMGGKNAFEYSYPPFPDDVK